MPQPVTVIATKEFSHGGRTYQEGEPVTVTPFQAAILGRRGQVNLSKQVLQNRQMTAVTVQALPPRGRRRKQYRRADMVSDSTE